MPRKIALFAFNGEPMCFAHVLLNAFDLRSRGHEVRIVIEGTVTGLIKKLHEDESMPFANQWRRAVAEGFVDCVCQACAEKTGGKPSALDQGLELCGEMNGHPALGRYLEQGYEIFIY